MGPGSAKAASADYAATLRSRGKAFLDRPLVSARLRLCLSPDITDLKQWARRVLDLISDDLRTLEVTARDATLLVATRAGKVAEALQTLEIKVTAQSGVLVDDAPLRGADSDGDSGKCGAMAAASLDEREPADAVVFPRNIPDAEAPPRRDKQHVCSQSSRSRMAYQSSIPLSCLQVLDGLTTLGHPPGAVSATVVFWLR